ncbi:uncharacterized protein LOC123295606 [Chrysoperla carnea]|uniref:uncharacterized protein LOC123295606 n=1 Tax=Chrysoperla carnea TaxID=189513 RepID=UPI001D071483|nr:uncharacterized protein LOC123295606 [Chrysoperla carnea]
MTLNAATPLSRADAETDLRNSIQGFTEDILNAVQTGRLLNIPEGVTEFVSNLLSNIIPGIKGGNGDRIVQELRRTILSMRADADLVPAINQLVNQILAAVQAGQIDKIDGYVTDFVNNLLNNILPPGTLGMKLIQEKNLI